MSKGQLNSESICRQYFTYIRKKVRTCGVPERNADDVVQDVLLAIHRSLPTYNPAAGKLEQWISGVTRNVAMGHLKKQYREAVRRCASAVNFEDLSIADPASTAEEGIMERDDEDAAEEDRRFLYDVIARMPDKHRHAFTAHELECKTLAAIADDLGAPATTVQSWIKTVWAELEKAWKRRRAQQRRTVAQVLPISVVALVERERARLDDLPPGDFDQAWARVQRTLAEERAQEEKNAREEQSGVPAPFKPSPPPSLPGPRLPVNRLIQIGASCVSGAVGGVIACMLMHGASPPTPSPNFALTVVSSTIPNSGASAPPWSVVPASSATMPSAISPAPGSQGAAPAPASVPALPSASRRTVLDAPANEKDTEEHLMMTASDAIERGDFEKARAILNHLEREFPNSYLKTNRDILRQRLPR